MIKTSALQAGEAKDSAFDASRKGSMFLSAPDLIPVQRSLLA
jgi:hypothetical protein